VHQKKHRAFFILWALTVIIRGQVSLDIAEYRPFPEKIMLLDLKPDLLNWSIANRFLLLDKSKHELIELGPFGDVVLSSGFGLRSQRYGELIWMGISPHGILIVDRLGNQITVLDYRLNPVTSNGFEPRIFPEHAAVDPWGRIYLYSNQYNSIFLYDGELDQQPLIDLNRVVEIGSCLQDLEINQDGELAILDCEGTVHFFHVLGNLQYSYPSHVRQAKFLTAVRNKWFVFNSEGNGRSVQDQEPVSIPGASIPVLDITSMNRSIAILARDHILVLNVQSH
tara:strand:+ start:3490 stop:4332 length:843 start_codon:yes stop_codon:yes gene_type:complete